MTVTAVERLGVDAAIIFADILLIIEPMGIELEFARVTARRYTTRYVRHRISIGCAKWQT